MQLWNGIRQRILDFYKQAASAYFKFLRLHTGAQITDDFSPREGSESLMEQEQVGDANIVATLRLLRLFVKYAHELKEHTQQEFSETPTVPWLDVVPQVCIYRSPLAKDSLYSLLWQLFARLGHPDPFVQEQVTALLARIGKAFPHTVVYPTVAGMAAANMGLTGVSKKQLQGLLKLCGRRG